MRVHVCIIIPEGYKMMAIFAVAKAQNRQKSTARYYPVTILKSTGVFCSFSHFVSAAGTIWTGELAVIGGFSDSSSHLQSS